MRGSTSVRLSAIAKASEPRSTRRRWPSWLGLGLGLGLGSGQGRLVLGLGRRWPSSLLKRSAASAVVHVLGM